MGMPANLNSIPSYFLLSRGETLGLTSQMHVQNQTKTPQSLHPSCTSATSSNVPKCVVSRRMTPASLTIAAKSAAAIAIRIYVDQVPSRRLRH
jgi:hypothetical protein